MANINQIKTSLNLGNFQIIETDKLTAKAIASSLLTKGWWFISYDQENSYFIITSENVDLNWYHKRGYDFTIA